MVLEPARRRNHRSRSPYFDSRLNANQILFALGLTLVYMFLSIQLDDTSVLDFIKQGVKYFLLTQQYYEWKEDKTE